MTRAVLIILKVLFGEKKDMLFQGSTRILMEIQSVQYWNNSTSFISEDTGENLWTKSNRSANVYSILDYNFQTHSFQFYLSVCIKNDIYLLQIKNYYCQS